MEILCPKCRKKYVVSDTSAGKQARCKNQSCGQVFTIAARAASAPAAAPVKPAPPAGGGTAMSSLLDDLPPLPLDNFPLGDFPAAGGPNFSPLPSKSSRKSKRPSSFALKLGGGIVAMLVVGLLLVLVVSKLFVGGGNNKVSEWPPYYFIPENAQFIAHVNVDELRKSDLYAEVQKLVEKQSPRLEGNFSPDDVGEIFLAGRSYDRDDNPLVVIRMKRDRSLSDMLPAALRGQPTKTYRNAEYAVLDGPSGAKKKNLFFAKTGDRTFCLAPSEETLKDALDRRDRKERAKLDANLQAAIDSPSGGFLNVAGVNLTNPNVPFAVKRFSGRVSVASSLRIELTVGFDDPNVAANCKKSIDGLLASLSFMMPPDKKQVLQPILSAVKIRQDGKDLRCEATWQNQDVLSIIKIAKESGGAFPSPPGAIPGQPALPPAAM